MARNKVKLRSVVAGQMRWLVRPDWPPDQKLLEHPDDYLIDRQRIIKCSDNVTIGRIAVAKGGPNLILRRLNYRNLQPSLRDFFRPTRARLAMMRGLALDAARVPTARVLAVAEVRFLRWPRRAYLITEEVAGAESVELFIRLRRRVHGDVLATVASALAKLHDAGFSHRDLKPSNILIDQNRQAALIDLDAIRCYRQLPERRAREDLERLRRGVENVPRISALHFGRFIRHYCKARGFKDWRRWWREMRLERERCPNHR